MKSCKAFRRHDYLKIIEENLLPINELIKHLDIGTGPAPSLFAFSDIVKFFKEFCEEKGYGEYREIEYYPDYVENSHSFRHWLHHFTEYVNYKNNSGPWNVPYHHGSFHDFESLDFKTLNYNKAKWQKERVYEEFGSNQSYNISEGMDGINVYGKNFMSALIYDESRNTHRYDIISFSYFLTKLEQVKKWKKQIKGCALALKNNGILINIGATNNEYFQIGRYLRRTIHRYHSKNVKYKITCREVFNDCITYDTNDMFGKRIKQSYDFIISKLKEYQADNRIPQKIYTDITTFIDSGKTEKQKEFRLQIFQKRIIPAHNILYK